MIGIAKSISKIEQSSNKERVDLIMKREKVKKPYKEITRLSSNIVAIVLAIFL